MARKNYYYVLVFTDAGPVYVTSLGGHNVCYWDRNERPMALKRYLAEEIAVGLRLNGSCAVMVTMPFDLEYQPYLYGDGQFSWVWNEKEDGNVNEE